MAQDKKSFILYTDLLHTIDLMPDENAGKLFKHILKYVNDLNPETDDLITKLSFEPIKQQLKRDLREWEKTIETKSDSGKLGNLKRWHLDLYLKVIDNQMNIDEAYVIANNRKTSHPDTLPSQPIPNIAVNVTESVNDNVIDNETKSIIYINPEFLKFNDWLKENAPNVLKLKEPISEAQYLKLKEFDRTIIKETLISMHNFKNLTKNYVSAYITLTNWIKRNNKNKNNQENEQSRIAKNIAVAKQYIEQSRDNGV